MSGGGNAFVVKDMEREARRAEIAKLTAEMMGSAPAVTKHPTLPGGSKGVKEDVANLFTDNGEDAPLVENESDFEYDDEEEEDNLETINNKKISPEGDAGSDDGEEIAEKKEEPDRTEDLVDTFALQNKIPISHQVNMPGHGKAVICLSCEPAGNRVYYYIYLF